MSNWIEVGKLEDIPRLGSRVVDMERREIAIFRTELDDIFAVANSCPHKKGPLAEGIVHGKKVTCPLHNWTIDLESGEAVAPDKGCARRYETKVESGMVWINSAEA
ncbi:MAG: nitrite reductase small subunit NirD [Gammaproteobacteria bacterium]|nr:nitrite reductase small subunit NirD [Gammaproteobacteria bacterium]